MLKFIDYFVIASISIVIGLGIFSATAISRAQTKCETLDMDYQYDNNLPGHGMCYALKDSGNNFNIMIYKKVPE